MPNHKPITEYTSYTRSFSPAPLTGLRHVTRMAASYVLGIDRPLNSKGQDAATAAAEAAVLLHEGGVGLAANALAAPPAADGASPMEVEGASTQANGAEKAADAGGECGQCGNKQDGAGSPKKGKGEKGGEEDEEEADAPKLLADLVEAVIGGVLIDCDGGGGQGLTAAWEAYCGLAHAAGMAEKLRLVRPGV